MMTAGATSCGARDHSRSPFTPTQWQELEHQALIYKYMVSGVSIPPELIYSVKRSLDSSLASRLFPPQHIGWGFQVGFGRKADPEPGRCRRTDGKKWRCSKEAYPDSKYCERHMHRGRNRSRKHVEVITSSSTASAISSSSTGANPSPSVSSLNRNLCMNSPNSSSSSPSSSSYSFSPVLSSSISPEMYAHQDPTQKSSHLNPFLYPHSSCSRPPGSSVLSPHENMTTQNLFLDTGSSSHVGKDYRYFHGIREGLDERAFFPEASGSVRSFQDSCQPFMKMDGSYKGYSRHYQSQFENFSDSSKQQTDQEQHCFVLGTDFKSSSTRTTKIEKEDETLRPLHHFFGEWPPKNTDSWLDLSSNSRIHSDS